MRHGLRFRLRMLATPFQIQAEREDRLTKNINDREGDAVFNRIIV